MPDPNDHGRRWPYSPRGVPPTPISTLAKEAAQIIGLSLFGVAFVLALLWLTLGEG